MNTFPPSATASDNSLAVWILASLVGCVFVPLQFVAAFAAIRWFAG